MDSVNRGGCAKEGARVFRAGAAAQVIRNRGGADDEELIVQQVDKPPQLLVASAEASTFAISPTRETPKGGQSVDVAAIVKGAGRIALSQTTIAANLRCKHVERRQIPTNASASGPWSQEPTTHRPNSRARNAGCETAG